MLPLPCWLGINSLGNCGLTGQHETDLSAEPNLCASEEVKKESGGSQLAKANSMKKLTVSEGDSQKKNEQLLYLLVTKDCSTKVEQQ